MLAMSNKDVEEHELEVARLTEQLRVVQAETEWLKTQRATLLSSLSPMRKLPNEILLRIFQQVCDENLLQCYPWLVEEDPPTSITSPVITYLPTMAISSVCSRWRALALSSPSLWAGLKLEICTTTVFQSKTLTGFADTVTRYLDRSGDWPLKISLGITGLPIGGVPSLIHLKEHAWHWKTFRYEGDFSLLGYGLLYEMCFPILGELDIPWITTSDELDLFEQCPRLHALSASWPEGPTSSVPYNQLDYLNLGQQSTITDLVQALHSCPSLKCLEAGLLINESEDADLEQGGHGTWPDVALLTIDGSSSYTMFSSFDFPSLNHLVIDGLVDWPADIFLSFVSRSSCIITTFTLRGISMSDLDLIAALRVMPALLHFELDIKYEQSENPITSHLISNLTHRDHKSTSSPLVPKLHSFHLRYQAADPFDDAAFVSMVQSRWFKPGSPLSAKMSVMGRSSIRSVVLKFTSREVNLDIYRPLRVLDAEGLRVVVDGTNGVQI
ncbi:hypothetical protein BDP27DRAFT_1330676 [Rhodocollybia butyracea]|uniref:F-box domain-containing protein n=1 Tax=Rhodocollybia butyracea TaxID=206335 RepID=A0A9P5U567_9AGAR|nr:hypothetical protein BDP27DRAFT_1330676 [Rhodocollybia butyracea]